jgi:small-conductance mechanosensitive channel
MDFTQLTTEQWEEIGISLLFIGAIAILGRWLIKIILRPIMQKLVGMTESSLDDIFLNALRGPAHRIIVIAAFDYGLRRLDFLPEELAKNLEDIFFVLYFVTVALFLFRIISSLFDWYAGSLFEKKEMNQAAQMLPFLRRVALIIVGVIVLVSLLGRFTDVSALLTTLGVGTLAIALAAQTALEDMFAGFLIMFDRPYLIGDRIEIQALDTWGDVIDIGIRSTRIRTRDNRSVVIPNSVMGKSMIVNYSRPDTQYRIQIELGLAYGTDVEVAKERIIEAVRGVEGVLAEKRIEALFLQFGESALIFRVRWWLDSFYDARRMFDRVNTAIYRNLTEAGISIPNPQLDVHHHIPKSQGRQFIKVFQSE